MPATDNPNAQASQSTKKRPVGQKRPGRPATLMRRATPSKLGHKTSSSQSSVVSTDALDEEMMATTFQQFCATCEKQMIVSNPTILYCSEQCRNQDSDSQSLPLFKTDLSPPLSPYETSPPEPPPTRDIVPQRSPTARLVDTSPTLPQQHESQRHSSEPSVHDSKATDTHSIRPSIRRSESEAARYLAQFGSHESGRGWHSRNSSTATDELTPSPSLTPTSSTSATLPFTPRDSFSSTRRPSRANPRWSSTSFSNRSVDLVTPVSHASSLMAKIDTSTDKQYCTSGTHEQEYASLAPGKDTAGSLSYVKVSSSDASTTPGKSNLKQLFCFEEMRSDPARPKARRNLSATSPLSPLSTNSAGTKT